MTDSAKDDEVTGTVVEDEGVAKKELILLVISSLCAGLAAVVLQDILMRKLPRRIKVP
jgi:hypothetical protein